MVLYFYPFQFCNDSRLGPVRFPGNVVFVDAIKIFPRQVRKLWFVVIAT